MPFSFYTATISTSINSLNSLTAILKKAEQTHQNPNSLLSARLAPDMRPLTSQIHLCCQAISRMLARINGVDFIPPIDDIATFGDMYARIQSTLSTLESLDERFVNSRADLVEPTVLTDTMTKEMSASEFAMGASMPNVLFHVCMAYAVLRGEGVGLGKWDYIEGFMGPVLQAK